MIDMEDIHTTVHQTIYSKDGVWIIMTVDVVDGKTKFEGFIDGNYVPLSIGNHLYSTVSVLNDELFFRGKHDIK